MARYWGAKGIISGAASASPCRRDLFMERQGALYDFRCDQHGYRTFDNTGHWKSFILVKADGGALLPVGIEQNCGNAQLYGSA